MGNKTRNTANLVSDNNLFVDIANDRVGIGSTQPTAKLNVVGVVSATSFRGDGSQLSGISVDSTSLVDSNSATRVQATTSGAVVTGVLTATQLFGDASNVTGIVTTNLGKANVTIGDNPPGIGTASGDLWWESDTAKGHIYYDDGSSAQWVEFNPSSGGGGGGGGGSYGNADVDSHLNITSASSGQILSWNGSDYAWVADQTGGGGSGITTANINADTINTGTLNVTGVSTFHGNVNLRDNDKLNLGNNNDLIVYHQGTNSFVLDQGAGNLILGSNGSKIRLVKDQGAEVLADFSIDGSVDLYYDNSKKFETLGAGVTVTGTTFSDQLSVVGYSTFKGRVVYDEILEFRGLEIGGANTLDFYDSSSLLRHSIGYDGAHFTVGGGDSVKIDSSLAGDVKISRGGVGIATFTESGLNVTGVVTATSFSGDGSALTGIVTSIVAGTNVTVSNTGGTYTINSSGGSSGPDPVMMGMIF